MSTLGTLLASCDSILSRGPYLDPADCTLGEVEEALRAGWIIAGERRTPFTEIRRSGRTVYSGELRVELEHLGQTVLGGDIVRYGRFRGRFYVGHDVNYGYAWIFPKDPREMQPSYTRAAYTHLAALQKQTAGRV